jgi:hypothetical protein
MAGDPITAGVHTLTVEFGSSGDAYQSIGVTDSAMNAEVSLGRNSMYMSNSKGSFGLIRGKTYRNGNAEKSAFDLRGKTVTMTLDMDKCSVSFRVASGGEEYTMDDLPSSVYPICGVDENWVRIVESPSSSASAVSQQQPMQRQRKSKSCPRGHILQQFQTRHAGYNCDLCGSPTSPCIVKIAVGSTMHGCRTCDFDVCLACFNDQVKERQAEKKIGDRAVKIGDRVQVRDVGGEWGAGEVTQTEPVKVLRKGYSKAFTWDEMRKEPHGVSAMMYSYCTVLY